MNKSIQYEVEGMTCGNCALSITNYLTKNGATNAVANAATGDVSFEIPDELIEQKLKIGINNLGFQVKEETLTNEHEHYHVHSQVKLFLLISLMFWIPLMAHMFISWGPLHNPFVQLFLTIPVYIIGIIYFGKSALRSLKNGIPNMDVLVFVGASAAFFYSIIGWYFYPTQVHHYLFFETTASIITLVLAGNFLEEFTVKSTASSIKELMKFQKTKAKLIFIDSIGKETIIETNNDAVKKDDIVLINSGDKVPVDGVIIKGQASIDESMMTGESIPEFKKENDFVIGGSIVTNGSLRIKATAVGKNSVLSTIINLINQAQATKPPLQKLADKISAIFVPLVLVIAIFTFLINFFIVDVSLQNSLMRTIAVLVIACPCAMGLATPAAIMVGLGRAAKNGILIKNGEALEQFKDIKNFVFDKTGTLTTGKLVVDNFETSIDENIFKKIVYSLEQHSSHPIAKSICNQWKMADNFALHSIEEIQGIGIQAFDENNTCWKIGSQRILDKENDNQKHDLFVLNNEELIGWIDLNDELRRDAKEVVDRLTHQGYSIFLVSGDKKEKCEKIAEQLLIKNVFSEQLPTQKLKQLEAIMQSGKTAMVGDGINDAPALTKAHIGISLSDASEIAMQSASVLLLKNNLSVLPMAVQLGKQTYLTIKQNLFWAFAYNIIAIPVAATGMLTPTWGAAIMALSDVVLIINSIRLRYKKLA